MNPIFQTIYWMLYCVAMFWIGYMLAGMWERRWGELRRKREANRAASFGPEPYFWTVFWIVLAITANGFMHHTVSGDPLTSTATGYLTGVQRRFWLAYIIGWGYLFGWVILLSISSFDPTFTRDKRDPSPWTMLGIIWSTFIALTLLTIAAMLAYVQGIPLWLNTTLAT